MRTNLRQLAAWTMVALVGVLSACSEAPAEKKPSMSLIDGQQITWEKQTAALQVAQDCDSALASFKQMLTTGMLLRLEEQRKYYIKYYGENGIYRNEYGPSMDASMSQDAGAEAPSQDKGGSENEGAGEYSETNVQVVGVDEADLVKTDGNLMFVLSGKDIVVVDAWPADQMHEVGRIALKADASGFFRTENRVVALSYVNRYQFEEQTQPEEPSGPYYDYGYYRYEPMTLVTVIDVTTPEAPVVLDETLFEGNMLDSRRIANKLYLVQQDYGYIWNNGIQYWPQVDLYGASDDKINQVFQELAATNQQYIDSLTLADVLPQYFKLGSDGLIDPNSAQAMTACTALYYPTAFSGTGLITAVTVDFSSSNSILGSSVLGDWGTLYVSTQALYVAATNWSWFWWWSEDEEQPEIITQIHKFTFDSQNGAAIYQASGTAPGYVLNQFSMDEFEGNLRVATTRPDWGWWDDENKSESYVTVLKQEGNLLTQLGQVGGLGMGETIQSVRFVGSRGYVVTFRQTDPLYVLDLSQPATPVVAGELKIPGFSSYIHPMEGTHLLTIGRDGDEEGNTFGVSFQIFDVTDAANPVLASKTTLGEDDGWDSYTWSDAMWDHHAFVYFASKKMLAIPISGWNWDEQGGSGYSNYLQLLHVDLNEGVTPFGTISHADLLGDLPEPSSEYCWYDMSWILNDRVQIRRGVFMDDFIYSISRGAVKVHDLRDLPAGEVNHVILQDNSDLPEYLEQYYGYCWYEA